MIAQAPVMSMTELRGIGREALEAFRSDIEQEQPKMSGRRAAARDSYLDRWARRYWKSQEAIERDRLRKGKAKYRAHRDPFPGKAAKK